MTSILETASLTVEGSTSIVGLSRYGEPGSNFGRHITLDGKRAYLLSTMCDTCPFIFERGGGANQSVETLSEALRDGVAQLDSEIVLGASKAMPDGDYRVSLLDVTPRLVWPNEPDDYFTHEQLEVWEIDPFWGLPHGPRVPYFRTETTPVSDEALLFEFIVPMFPPRWLDEETVQSYRERVAGGDRPTALALSILDVRMPADWEGHRTVTTHWCLAHFLLDGNHRVYAAARDGVQARLLSFLSLDWSIASTEQVEEAFAVLDNSSQAGFE